MSKPPGWLLGHTFYLLAVAYIALSILDLFTGGFTQIFFGSERGLAVLMMDNTLIWALIPAALFILGYAIERSFRPIDYIEPSLTNQPTNWKALTFVAVAILLFFGPDVIGNMTGGFHLDAYSILSLFLVLGAIAVIIKYFIGKKVS